MDLLHEVYVVVQFFCLYKSTIVPCMESCRAQAGAPSCYLDMLDKLQKQVCGTVCPSLAASVEPLAHRHNIVSLSLFYRYYFGRCSFELTEVVPLPCSCARSTRYSNKCYFSVTIPTCYKDNCINISTNPFRLQLDSGILFLKVLCFDF